MKRIKMLRAFSLIDDKYVEEADPNKMKKRKRPYKAIILAACLTALLTALGLWLFLPFNTAPPDVSQYMDSEYYPIIEKLNLYNYDTYGKPRYANNYEKYFASGALLRKVKDATNGTEIEEAPTEDVPGQAAGQQYQEITDNQVAGVIEGDIIKRSDKYIYYMYENLLRVYSIGGEESEYLGSYRIETKDENAYYTVSQEFYLSSDCTTVTVIVPGGSKTRQSFVDIVSLDVTDPTNIREKNRVSVDGSYMSSRVVDGKLLLLSEFLVERYSLDFSDETTFIPRVNTADGVQSIPIGNIISPDALTSSRYTVVCSFDENTLALEDSSAFLSYSEEIYVSDNSIYATRSFTDSKIDGDITTDTRMTEISRLSYVGESFEHKGSVTLAGTVKDQYSLDENNGILRVVTTTDYTKYEELRYVNGNNSAFEFRDMETGRNASLYCVDLDTMQVIAEVNNFAPEGETVQSVRFDGDIAYVCTALIEIIPTDPVFFFDLSDLDNITYKETGTIEGYSSSLVNFGDGYLLGIGRGAASDTFKIEIYEEGIAGVDSVCKYECEKTGFSSDYKSYYIDRENRFIGFGLNDYSGRYNDGEYNRYILLYFNGYELVELVNIPLKGAPEYKRAVCIDGYLYMFGCDYSFGGNDFKVEKIGG